MRARWFKRGPSKHTYENSRECGIEGGEKRLWDEGKEGRDKRDLKGLVRGIMKEKGGASRGGDGGGGSVVEVWRAS